MVAGPGLEPGTAAYEAAILPFHYPATVRLYGIRPEFGKQRAQVHRIH